MQDLIKHRDYHSQCSLELYTMIKAMEDCKDSWKTKLLIETLFNMAVINQRRLEFKIIKDQMSTKQISFNCTPEKMYQAYFIILKIHQMIAENQKFVFHGQILKRTSKIIEKTLLQEISSIILISESLADSEPEYLEKLVKLMGISVKNLNEIIEIK